MCSSFYDQGTTCGNSTGAWSSYSTYGGGGSYNNGTNQQNIRYNSNHGYKLS